MKRDWFCPCLLFWGGMIWLGVTGYFAATAWLKRTDTFETYKMGACTVATQKTEFCQVTVKGKQETRCRLRLAVFTNVSEPGEAHRPVNSIAVVKVPGVNDGCTFDNCGDTDKFFRDNVDNRTNTITCWQEYERAGVIQITDPNGNAKRNSILFTVLAAVAFLLVLAMIIVMVQLTCTAIKRDRD